MHYHATILSYLLSSIMQFLLRVFEHFLTPQVEEVIRIGIELQAVLAILPGVNAIIDISIVIELN